MWNLNMRRKLLRRDSMLARDIDRHGREPLGRKDITYIKLQSLSTWVQATRKRLFELYLTISLDMGISCFGGDRRKKVREGTSCLSQ